MKKLLGDNRVVMALYLLGAVGILIFDLYMEDREAVIYVILMPLFLLIPPVVERLFRIKLVPELARAIHIYAFLAFGLGVAARLYRYTQWYDKFVHFLAGYFFAIVGMAIYYYLKKEKIMEPDKEAPVVMWFSAATSMMIGVAWEICEYMDSLIFKTDPQHVLDTGIHDTMQDLLACALGAAVAIVYIYFYYKRTVKGPLLKTFESFFKANISTLESVD